MNNWLKILIGIAALLVLMWVLSAVAGLLFWGVVALVIGALFYAFVRTWQKKRQARKPPKGLLEEET
jgi:predicted membrane channel-forming protein YqfA (hemolysin III family)